MPSRDPRIDAYIAKAAPFAQPILTHLREVVHGACPGVEETVKWGSPHFDYKGIMCGMAAFKEHCAFGFWKGSLIPGLKPNSANGGEGMGNLGCIRTLGDLPPKKEIAGFVKAAMRLNDEGIAVVKRKKAPKPAADVPPDLAAALARNRKARSVFEGFPPSYRREYIEWVVGAKRDETRAKRIAQTIEWVAEGKQRNWKYQA